MIYDCFTFYDEFDLLEIRIHELKDVVDKFIIVEGNITFQHDPKPYYFNDESYRFYEFKDQIINIKCTGLPTASTWDTEFSQREIIFHYLSKICNDDDIIIIENADEIARASAVLRYLDSPSKRLMSLQQSHYYYYLNCMAQPFWCWPKIMPFHVLKERGNIREVTKEPDEPDVLYRAGWHFSYLGGAKKVVEKLRSFAHKELKETSEEYLQKCIREGNSFLKDDQKFMFVDIDESFPRYVVENQDRFSHLIASTSG